MKLKDVLLDHMLTHLLDLCKEELGLDQLPAITLVDKPVIGNGSSFGEFDGEIRVVTKDRHPMDVMRTLAHEIVHWKQLVNNEVMDGSDGSNTENDANAIAGVIMRKFGKMYPEYFMSALP
jgi:hypothetical protein